MEVAVVESSFYCLQFSGIMNLVFIVYNFQVLFSFWELWIVVKKLFG